MEESKIKREQYIVIQGFMVTDLKLKGNELLVYAIVYGFSQSEGQVFSGSLQYLADWLNASKQTVSSCLKSLVEKGFLEKKEIFNNGVKFCEYYAKNLNGVCKNFNLGMQKICTNNLYNNLDNNLEYNIVEQGKKQAICEEVINYLNDKCHTEYRAKSKATIELVNGRLSEGYTVEDFKRVIDNMASRWLGDEKMEVFLRPKTLFGLQKFESYLNCKPKANNDSVFCVYENEDNLDDLY